jgi:hypothetical protein
MYKKYIKGETLYEYTLAIEYLVKKNITLQAAVCDGRKGVLKLLNNMNIPVQMCQFHQQQIVTRYLTKNPKLQPNIELKKIALNLTKSTKNEFNNSLNEWLNKWKIFYDERTEKQPGIKSTFVHRRTRSAYRSLKQNLPYLFIYKEYPELMIPNTTNGLDGVFSDLKKMLRNHNGLTIERKKKFIDSYFKI